MPSDLTQIQTIRSQTLALLNDLTTNPKPNYTVEGRSFSWGEYQKTLRETIAWCNEQESAFNPVEILTQGYT